MSSEGRSLCIVPARGGSRRFPRKNVAPLGGKPLIAWTIEAALASGVWPEVHVSSEDDEILEVAEKWGATSLRRSDRLAGHRSTVFEVACQVTRELQNTSQGFDDVSVLLPTSPFRRPETIRDAMDVFRSRRAAAALMSVIPLDHPPEWAIIRNEDGTLRPLHPAEYSLPRHDLLPTYRTDGAIIIARLPDLLEVEDFTQLDPIAFEVAREEAVDIDEPIDMAWAEFLLHRKATEK